MLIPTDYIFYSEGKSTVEELVKILEKLPQDAVILRGELHLVRWALPGIIGAALKISGDKESGDE